MLGEGNPDYSPLQIEEVQNRIPRRQCFCCLDLLQHIIWVEVQATWVHAYLVLNNKPENSSTYCIWTTDLVRCPHSLFNHRRPFIRSLFSLGYGYFLLSVFPVLLGTSAGNLSQSFFVLFSQGTWHPLISKLSIVRALWPVNTPPDWKLPTIPEWCSYKGRGVVSTLVCANKVRNGPTRSTKAFLQPAMTATMCTACREYAHLTHLCTDQSYFVAL